MSRKLTEHRPWPGTADEPNPANQTSLSFRYLIAYYWALMNIMTVDSNDGGDIFPRTVSERIMSSVSMLVGVAVGETVFLLHPPLPVVGVSVGIERARQQNDRTLADG